MASPYRPLPPGVQRFRLDPASYRTVAARALVRRFAFGVVLGAPLLAAAAHINASNLGGYAVAITMAGIGIVLFLLWKLRTIGTLIAPALAQYELLLSDRVLRVSTGFGPPAEVLRPEVTAIAETPRGLWVMCTAPKRSILVMRALDGYADVREALGAWGALQPVQGRAARRLARREEPNFGPRDAILGTALASDTTLVAELESVRAASINGQAMQPGTPVPRPRGGPAMATAVVLALALLAIWQVLQPAERRPVRTDEYCQTQRACRAFGSCKAEGYRCVAATDEDCKQSELCTKLGRCKEVGGACYAPGDNVGNPPPGQ